LYFVLGKLRYEEILIILLGLRLGGNTEVKSREVCLKRMYEGWNFNSGNYLFTTDTK